jgi:phospholipase C
MNATLRLLRFALIGFVSFAYCQVTPIRHVVFIIKENRSFDHMFGTMPGVNGAMQGRLSSGVTIPLSHAPDKSGNYAHSWGQVVRAINHGKMDLFDTTFGCGGPGYLCYSQYREQDIPNYFAYARNYLIADNFFSSMAGPSFPNHQYTIAAQSNGMVSNPRRKGQPLSLKWGCDSPEGSFVISYDPNTKRSSHMSPCQDYATLADLLDAAGISWKYYAPEEGTPGYQWSAFDAVNHIRNGAEWQSNVVPFAQFIDDAANPATCMLPAMSWLIPDTHDSEHPTAPISQGQNWTTKQINAVMQGPCWSSTAIFVTWDDNGGYYDHVPPPTVDGFGSGIRVPLLIVSPFVTSGTVYSKFGTFDSVLAFVEANWRLGTLMQRDRTANNLMDAFSLHGDLGVAPALVLPLMKTPEMSPQQLNSLDDQVLQERLNDGVSEATQK